MSLPGQASSQMMVTRTGTATYQINNSLRFRANASTNLNRTPAAAGSTTAWTMSFWAKIVSPTNVSFFAAGSGQGNGTATERMNLGTTLYWQRAVIQTANVYDNGSTAVVRDFSAWYHVVMVWDSNNATAALRQKYYVNGVLLTNNTGTAAGSGQNSIINSNINHRIGLNYDTGTSYGDFYLAEFNFIDGQILTASNFGAYDTNGIWQPIKYTGTYGTNGYYLNFSNTASTAALGNDSSGNGNNWTVNNLSLTAGSTYDIVTDSPTPYSATVGNYCVFNPLNTNNPVTSTITLSNGNLQFVGSNSNTNQIVGTSIGFSTGKWYCEVQLTVVGGNYPFAGIVLASSNLTGTANASLATFSSYWIGNNTLSANDLIGMAVDMNALTIQFYKNGVAVGSAVSIAAGTYMFAVSGLNGCTWIANFGQQPFVYSPPSGFYRLNTWNLSASTILNGAQYMAATLYTGNSGGTLSVVNSQSNGGNNPLGKTFQPDFLWIKYRAAITNWAVADSVRGVTKQLSSSLTNAEATTTDGITSFNSNGFSLGANTTGYDTNSNSGNYVAYQWLAGAGVTVPNIYGSITSTLSANPTAGFSVATYTGNGTAGATVGHGLGVVPSMVIVKARGAATDGNWRVKTTSLSSNYNLALNTTDAQFNVLTSSNGGIGDLSSSTTFTLANGTINNNNVNQNTQLYVAYCWAAVPGYSAFGSYTGNGSTDGPFIYLGFRPRWWLVKRTDTVESWNILDSSRDPYNQAGINLYPNLTNAESSNDLADLVSNGVKLRNTWTGANTNGGTYIYAAFAENPFAIARAR